MENAPYSTASREKKEPPDFEQSVRIWNHEERAVLDQLLALLTPVLVGRIGAPVQLSEHINTALGTILGFASHLLHRRQTRIAGPDRMRIYEYGLPVPGNLATTLGSCVHLKEYYEPQEHRFLLNHEYVHVLQYRAYGTGFLPVYLLERIKARQRGEHPYLDHPLEVQALEIEALLKKHNWLPNLWELGQIPGIT